MDPPITQHLRLLLERNRIRRDYEGTAVDVWSLGVVLYAMVHRYLPFEDDTLYGLYSKIQNERVNFPSYTNEEVKDLLVKILEPNPVKRFTIRQILEHSWMRREKEDISPENKNKFKLNKRVNKAKLRVLERIFARHDYKDECMLGFEISRNNFSYLETLLAYNNLMWKSNENIVRCKTEDEKMMIEIKFFTVTEDTLLLDFHLIKGKTLPFLDLINNIRSSFEIKNAIN